MPVPKSTGGIRAKLRVLMKKKIAGVPAPIVLGGVAVIAGLAYWQYRRKGDLAPTEEDYAAEDYSAGIADEGEAFGGVGGIGGGGAYDTYGGDAMFVPEPSYGIPSIPYEVVTETLRGGRGGRARRPAARSREQVNRRAIREAKARARAALLAEQRARRQALRRREDRSGQRERRQKVTAIDRKRSALNRGRPSKAELRRRRSPSPMFRGGTPGWTGNPR